MYLNIKKGGLVDPKNITIDVQTVGNWGKGDYLIKMTNPENLSYIVSLARQAFESS
jgi:predicted transport protein